MISRKLTQLIVGVFFMLMGNAVFAACATCSISNSQPANNSGLSGTFLGGPAASTLSALAGGVSGFVSGGSSGNAGLDFKRYAIGNGTTGAAAAPGSPQWNVWGAYSHSNVGYSYQPLSSAGNVNVYLAGVDYTFSNNVVFGVATAFDHTSTSLNFSGGSLGGSGYTISPYVGVLINKNMVFDGTVGYGRTNIDTAVQGVGGSTHSNRLLGALGLSYREAVGDWTFTGRGAVLGVQNKLAGNTLTDGTVVAGSTTNLSQLRLSAQAAYSFGKFTPYASIGYIYDMSHPDQAPVSNIPVSNDRDGWLPLVGMRFKFDNMVYGSVQYQSERGRQQIRNDMFLFNLGIRF